MHAAIALKKEIVVWFGVSCPAEIDLYERGIKLIPVGLACSPCWKRTCPFNLECIQQIDLDAIVRHVESSLAQRAGSPSAR
jgi:heptosyltransferase-2